MKENRCILVTYTNLLLLCKCIYDIFLVNISKPTSILYGRSVERTTIEADITYIKKYTKNSRVFYPIGNNFKNWSLCLLFVKFPLSLFLSKVTSLLDKHEGPVSQMTNIM